MNNLLLKGNFRQILLLIVSFIALGLAAQPTFRRGSLYMVSPQGQPTKNITLAPKAWSISLQPNFSDDSNLWTITSLSGSFRIINPFTNRALNATSDNQIASAENNGSDESQLWKIEPNGKSFLFIPSNRPELVAVCQSDGSIVLKDKKTWSHKLEAQFAIKESEVKGFDENITYQIVTAGKQKGLVLGSGNNAGNNAVIVPEKADKENLGQYWNIKMIDVNQRAVIGAFNSLNFYDGGNNKSINYLVQWAAQPGKWDNTRFVFKPVKGKKGIFQIASASPAKHNQVYALVNGKLERVSQSKAGDNSWFTFREVMKPKVSSNYWEDESRFAENKEKAIATYQPYRTEAEMLADTAYYRQPWKVTKSTVFMTLNGDWNFNLVSQPSERPLNFYKDDFDYSAWNTIPVPSNWEMQGYDHPIYANVEFPHADMPPFIRARAGFNDGGKNYGINPVGSYIRTFSLPNNWHTGRTILHFGGIYSAAFVYLNGKYVGYTQGANNVSEFDITPYLNTSGKNRIAVQVFRWSDGSYLECQDMFRMSGIFRDVTLYNIPRIAIRDHYITSTLDPASNYRNGKMNVQLEIDNRDQLSATKAYKVDLRTVEGRILGRAEQTVVINPTDTLVTLNFAIDVNDIDPWTAETPNLYKVHIVQRDVTAGEDMAFSTYYGFRDLQIRGNMMYINGKRLFLKGTNRHDTNPLRGRAVTTEDMLRDVLLMKQNNINNIRTSHYPNAARMYAMFDYYGLYTVDEADLEDHANQSISDMESWIPAFVDRVDRLVKRDRNHPSVVIWSLGNESGNGKNFAFCYDHVNAIDSRPIHYEGTRGGKDYGGGASSDFYSKMYPGMSWMYEYAAGFDKPLYVCEFAHAMGNAIGNLPEYMEAMEKNPSCIGGAIWDWVDQAIYDPNEIMNGTWQGRIRTGYDFPGPHQGNFCSNGILPPSRNESSKLAEVKGAYRYIKAKLLNVDTKKNAITVRIRNGYTFLPLNKFNLSVETLEAGYVVGTAKQLLPNVMSGDSIDITIALPKIKLLKDIKKNIEAIVNLKFTLADNTTWAKAGHLVSQAQFVLTNRTSLPTLAAPKTAFESVEDDARLHISGNGVEAKFDKTNGALVMLSLSGVEVVKGDSAGFVFDNHRWIENDRFENTSNGLNDEASVVTWNVDSKGLLTVTTSREGSLADQTIVYTFGKEGAMDVQVKLTPHTANLRRAGVSARLSNDFVTAEYYGLGPWENHNDRKAGVYLGRYTTTIDGFNEEYVKPQSMGRRGGMREVVFRRADGRMLSIQTSDPMAFSALHYTDTDLMKAGHLWQIEPRPFVFLHLDAEDRGVGNGSCGYDVGTLKQYCIPEKPIVYTFRLAAE